MTHLNHPQLLKSVLQLLSEEGSDGFAEGLRLLVNQAMQAERSNVLQAQPFERTDARLGHAHGAQSIQRRRGPESHLRQRSELLPSQRR